MLLWGRIFHVFVLMLALALPWNMTYALHLCKTNHIDTHHKVRVLT